MILLIMNVGSVLNAGFEVQYLLGNAWSRVFRKPLISTP